MTRHASLTRTTAETDIAVALQLEGSGRHDISTGIGFFDHMLILLAVHGLFDLTLKARGDLQVDAHHTVEDSGIALGAAFSEALGDRQGLHRIATSHVPLDEALARTVVDVSGRGYLAFEARFSSSQVGDFPSELVEDFLRALASHAKITLHVTLLAGRNTHHQIEVIFKSLGRALRQAVAIDPRQPGIPSSKGVLV
ncbi:MAG: imidazoleglycerol-phosphate dehydratase HisB [candidate division KSB1 bacterium]|nr:imidazoleglycerol-phosphate dehydratase HisB [candidate division KSB1 bacterium]MDZ7274402.1 imidazoleglycerol-phosphate dehydratase HisB [candidate division KSB1 bacterium]MDZ7284936.1 imidazoleglycerol-phosphate dehydratase HisB [candidate division KSB1 bacterium]MDZ7297643.1 imidazoleglycerol-phosphate dehydratase HisB [candidate division KSB1 bacterium]MDZ7348510.1 imidazoleglycerol-phosphate dehydratase HisB [candidate division KSB1 bacterium]